MSRLSLPVLSPGDHVSLDLVGFVHNELATVLDAMAALPPWTHQGQQLPRWHQLDLDRAVRRLRPRGPDDVQPAPPANVGDPLAGWLDAEYNSRRKVSGSQPRSKKWAAHRNQLQPAASDVYRRDMPGWLKTAGYALEELQTAAPSPPPTTNRRGATWR